MEDFERVFHEIDTNHDGIINQQEMDMYCDKMKIDKSFITKWLNLFDSNNDGVIEYKEFCQVLGIKNPNTVDPNMIEMTVCPNDPLKIFRKNLSPQLEEQIIKLVRELSVRPLKNSQLKKQIVEELNRTHQSYWNCQINIRHNKVVEHDPEGVIFFTPDGQRTFLIWRTDKKKGCCSCV